MIQDLRYAWRLLRKSPGFAAVIILTLALGIGANTAVFSVVQGVLLHRLPYQNPGELVDIVDTSTRNPKLAKTFDTYSDFEEYARSSHSFQKIAFATWAAGGATLTGYGPSHNVLAIPVSAGFFSMLGVNAVMGRTFEDADANRACSVVLSNGFWRSALGGDTSIIGRTLQLDKRACTVLGVMPAGFEFYPRATQMWMLLTADDPRPRDKLIVICFARLKPGVTAAQAQAELIPLHRSIHASDWQKDVGPMVNNLQDEFAFLAGRNLRSTLQLLLAAVGFVLLIACVNVANLLLGRLSARSREFAVRTALGSGRVRLVRQLFIEGLLLAAVGGLAGLGVAYGCVRYFLYANPIELPVGSSIAIDFTVFLFTAAVTVFTALIFGVAPALSGSRGDTDHGLRTGRGSIQTGNRRLTSILIGVEISLSLVLLTSAGLLMRSVLKMGAAPLGFAPENVLTVNSTLSANQYETLHQKLAAIPGVQAVAFASTFPPYGGGNYEMQIEGKDRTNVQDVQQDLVSADYFSLLKVRLMRGRLFTAHEENEPVAIVNEALVREYFPHADPIGKRIRAFGFKTGPWATIIGVVATEKHPELMHEMTWSEQAGFYRPIEQDPPATISIGVRVASGGITIGPAIGKVIQSLDANAGVGTITDLPTVLGSYLKYPRFRAVVIDEFAGLALLLCAVGLHGLIAQYVAQRKREIGLRVAIGAKKLDVMRLIAMQGGRPVAAGLIAGLALTILSTRFLTSLLYDVAPTDPLSMALAPALLVAAACLALAKPALDAVSVDPAVALRDE